MNETRFLLYFNVFYWILYLECILRDTNERRCGGRQVSSRVRENWQARVFPLRLGLDSLDSDSHSFHFPYSLRVLDPPQPPPLHQHHYHWHRATLFQWWMLLHSNHVDPRPALYWVDRGRELSTTISLTPPLRPLPPPIHHFFPVLDPPRVHLFLLPLVV